MIVVSDTTPLISLMKIGRLNLIEQLFGEVQIPDAVYVELVSNSEFEEEVQQIPRLYEEEIIKEYFRTYRFNSCSGMGCCWISINCFLSGSCNSRLSSAMV